MFLLRHGVMPGLHWVPNLLIFPGRGLAGHIKTPLHLTLLPTLGHLLPHCSPLEYLGRERWAGRHLNFQTLILQFYKVINVAGRADPVSQESWQKTGIFICYLLYMY